MNLVNFQGVMINRVFSIFFLIPHAYEELRVSIIHQVSGAKGVNGHGKTSCFWMHLKTPI